MYAFKVFVSTLVMIMIGLMFYSATQSEKKGRLAALLMAVVYGLCLIALWG